MTDIQRSWTAMKSLFSSGLLLVLCGCMNMSSRPSLPYSATIAYTSYGIPHITAPDWASLGYGLGYAAADDNLCVLADAFVTLRGERSRTFGAEATQTRPSTWGYPTNLDSDFFFRHMLPDDLIARFHREQPRTLTELTTGYAAGYSRYVREIHQGARPERHQSCRSAQWLTEITDADLYRRMYSLSLTPGLINYITPIARARPNAGIPTAAISPQQFQFELGSNAIGFGSAATGSEHGLLFGNPHWLWDGIDRFHLVHLRIPGKLDVQGVSILGLPLVMLGFNANVAWSHTVSSAKRFTPYRLKLAPGDPTSYLYDGQVRKMIPHRVTIETRKEDGSVDVVSRILYRSHYGPMMEAGWTSAEAVSIRDVNEENFRVLRTWQELAQAGSLDEFIAIQQRELGLTMVNTIAVGRRDPRAWFADIGTIPHVEDAKFAMCNVGSRGTLDGSRSACEWGNDPDAPQRGMFGLSKLPSLVREDYVANMNDSPWLTNTHVRLSVHAQIMGINRGLTLRTRMGHILVRDRLSNADGYGDRVTNESVRRAVLDTRVLSAELFLNDLLKGVCAPASEEFQEACSILSRWNRRGDPDSVGAHIWETFWESALKLRPADLYTVTFDPADPLNTPRGLKLEKSKIGEIFASTIRTLEQNSVPLDAPLGAYQYLEGAKGEHIALAGGCGDAGYFAVVCTRMSKTGPTVVPHGNSYLQVVGFSDSGVEAYALLLSSQSTDPASPHFRDFSEAYSRKQWHRLPFTSAEIAAAQIDFVTLN